MKTVVVLLFFYQTQHRFLHWIHLLFNIYANLNHWTQKGNFNNALHILFIALSQKVKVTAGLTL